MPTKCKEVLTPVKLRHYEVFCTFENPQKRKIDSRLSSVQACRDHIDLNEKIWDISLDRIIDPLHNLKNRY